MADGAMTGAVIGVDLGGTKMLAGAVDGAGAVSLVERALTEAGEGQEAVIGRLVALCERIRAGLPSGTALDGVAIGVPGGCDIEKGVVDKAPNLGWEHVPLASILSARLGVPVFLDNDVRVAVLGEHAGGAGRGAQTMVGVWVGTGIGGGIIVGGKLLQGARGVAGEIGHSIVVKRGPKCHCGNRGCIEALASRTSIERDVRAAIEHGGKSRVLDIMKKKGRDVLSSGVVARALEKGDPVMTHVLRRAQKALGRFTSNLVNTLDPEVVVFGGGLAERLGEQFVGPIREEAQRHFLSKRDLDKVRIVPTQLKEVAPVVGAAFIARERLARRGGVIQMPASHA